MGITWSATANPPPRAEHLSYSEKWILHGLLPLIIYLTENLFGFGRLLVSEIFTLTWTRTHARTHARTTRTATLAINNQLYKQLDVLCSINQCVRKQDNRGRSTFNPRAHSLKFTVAQALHTPCNNSKLHTFHIYMQNRQHTSRHSLRVTPRLAN